MRVGGGGLARWPPFVPRVFDGVASEPSLREGPSITDDDIENTQALTSHTHAPYMHRHTTAFYHKQTLTQPNAPITLHAPSLTHSHGPSAACAHMIMPISNAHQHAPSLPHSIRTARDVT